VVGDARGGWGAEAPRWPAPDFFKVFHYKLVPFAFSFKYVRFFLFILFNKKLKVLQIINRKYTALGPGLYK
jgi:hypothetical protein